MNVSVAERRGQQVVEADLLAQAQNLVEHRLDRAVEDHARRDSAAPGRRPGAVGSLMPTGLCAAPKYELTIHSRAAPRDRLGLRGAVAERHAAAPSACRGPRSKTRPRPAARRSTAACGRDRGAPNAGPSGSRSPARPPSRSRLPRSPPSIPADAAAAAASAAPRRRRSGNACPAKLSRSSVQARSTISTAS